mmetsp:Transcript_62035/g.166009  ORF Transcript_62035/g.166009 Transcript_62035/m.166009 type:complete len:234 (-) Transcript_62035:148-849(-)
MRTGLPRVASQGPLTVVHIRRTDKAKDFIGGSQSEQERASFAEASAGNIAASLKTFSNTLLPWVEGTKGPISSLFVMSDDWHAFEPEALSSLTRGMKTQPSNVLFDNRSRQLEPQDEKTLQMGNEAWGNKAATGMYILAASYALGKWADNIVGCGSSGVTQLVAQLTGGRLGVDPNSVGMWEDDSVNVEAATLGPVRSSFLALDLEKRPESRPDGNLWGTVSEAVNGFMGRML